MGAASIPMLREHVDQVSARRRPRRRAAGTTAGAAARREREARPEPAATVFACSDAGCLRILAAPPWRWARSVRDRAGRGATWSVAQPVQMQAAPWTVFVQQRSAIVAAPLHGRDRRRLACPDRGTLRVQRLVRPGGAVGLQIRAGVSNTRRRFRPTLEQDREAASSASIRAMPAPANQARRRCGARPREPTRSDGPPSQAVALRPPRIGLPGRAARSGSPASGSSSRRRHSHSGPSSR